MANHTMSTDDPIESLTKDEYYRRQRLIRYRYTAQERKRLRQQQIKDDLRGLRVPSIVCLVVGVLFTLGSVAMTVCGYYAESIATQDADNSTVYVDEHLKEHLEDLKKVGPVLVGCGIFTSMCALVIVFETRNDKNESTGSKEEKHNNTPCLMEYSFGATQDDSNAGAELKQLTTLDVDNLPQTPMQHINDIKLENETKVLLTAEPIAENNCLQTTEQITNCSLKQSQSYETNNHEFEYDRADVSDSNNRNTTQSKFPLINCAPKSQPLPPLDLKSSREEVAQESGISRVPRGNKRKQKRKPQCVDTLSEKANQKKNQDIMELPIEKPSQNDKGNIVDEGIKSETENDTFKLIEASGDVDQKKGKRRSLRGSLKRKRKSSNTVQPSDNAAFDVTLAENDDVTTERHPTSRSQPSSSTFSRKFSNEAWPDGSNDSKSVGKTPLNGTFRSESNLVGLSSNTAQKVLVENPDNSNISSSRNVRTKDSEISSENGENV
ncbi:uncharacterized protein LOC117121685 [Anneissia japonica]|uniref:uncharacterized protein LOC117121685 n=1 Tax=Anneissia japonica TaxID=1529436 RepID=UPI001425A65A|nr:uncharacterized protein LOC117121685 [Anneissia japonica]XP_033122855.1 uncharacterized protein LOC117121685 [Anneissia japonica]XP_033122856.1 uncharacterized protein LOC117121685 [Anneissia japonica]XP_033122857.1 uncharacterized protein LOC117121685 [Anneissia japonica]XP_033122858.1 uncharacterized protein LOC117121685 [Anneissia japonica]XP_033122859.1 uncharacterized protein LOC117121685 [Anneissia japonica]XP_033122860.1 uncharacterized protein LOC117121685 [Anneissia japonica]